MKIKGTVFNIQRYSVDDGPGIRTLVFMKGCPLRCLWCSNPEGQRIEPSLLYVERLCINCRKCTIVCPSGAVEDSSKGLKWNRARCIECFRCVSVCPSEARQVCGDSFTVEQLMAEVEKDRAYYRRSGGGVTLGGGDPLLQSGFCAAFLEEAKKRNLHTAVETCGYAKWEALQAVMRHADLMFMDIKHMDPAQHKKLTGKSNQLILNNIKKASKAIDEIWQEIIIRIPVIPTLNDSESNIESTAEFVKRLGTIKKIELLPYHNMGQIKYLRTKWTKSYPLSGLKRSSDDAMQKLKDIIMSIGIESEIRE